MLVFYYSVSLSEIERLFMIQNVSFTSRSIDFDDSGIRKAQEKCGKLYNVFLCQMLTTV